MALPIIKIENARGEVLDLSTDPRYEPILTGTGPPPATINRAKVAVSDGTIFNSATVGERPLMLTVYLKADIARARLNLYRFLTSKAYIKVYYQADGLDVWVDGYVETVEVDPWTQNQYVGASIVCPNPYWKDLQETLSDASIRHKLLEFPFSISSAGAELSTADTTNSVIVNNDGDVETGVVIELVVTSTLMTGVTTIYNLTTGEYFAFNFAGAEGARAIINTNSGQKAANGYYSDGEYVSLLQMIRDGSTWLKLVPGANEITYTQPSNEDRWEMHIRHTNMYSGV